MELISRTSLDKLLTLIETPYKLWNKCDARQKKEFYYYIFGEDFTINAKYESRTTSLSPIYQYLQGDFGKSSSGNSNESRFVEIDLKSSNQSEPNNITNSPIPYLHHISKTDIQKFYEACLMVDKIIN